MELSEDEIIIPPDTDPYTYFQVDGDAMLPVLRPGIICLCRPLDSLEEIKDGEIHAVKNNGDCWVMYAQRIFGPSGKVAKLKMAPANLLSGDAFEIEVNDTTQAFKVMRKIEPL